MKFLIDVPDTLVPDVERELATKRTADDFLEKLSRATLRIVAQIEFDAHVQISTQQHKLEQEQKDKDFQGDLRNKQAQLETKYGLNQGN